jgi:starch synthase
MPAKLRVAYISPEVAPFAKSGEMADVAASLPKYLSSLGIEVYVFMPLYRKPEIESLPKEIVASDLKVPLGDKNIKARVLRSEQGKYDIYFIDCPQYFMRENIYGTGREEYLDNDERFVFFNRAILEFLAKEKREVDVFHCNNWPTALVPVFLKTHYSRTRLFKLAASVITLHNIAYQGEFPPDSISLTGLSWRSFGPECLSLRGKFNFLKAGVVFSDKINTVSSYYRREILTKKHGFGMHQVLAERKKDLFAIRNGIDHDVWNPETDPYIISNYSSDDTRAKADCKQDLIEEFGLPLSLKTPLLGIISHFSAPKGLDILLEALDDLMEMEVGLIALGHGSDEYESRLLASCRRYPDRMAVKSDLSPGLVHKLIAGVDIILIPSRYEPCGLNQLYGFRYGTVPIVRAIGGLKETVKPFSSSSSHGNGFVFKDYSSQALRTSVEQAVKLYQKPRIWKSLMRAGLKEEFSWEKAAKRHVKLYQQALIKKRGGKVV